MQLYFFFVALYTLMFNKLKRSCLEYFLFFFLRLGNFDDFTLKGDGEICLQN